MKKEGKKKRDEKIESEKTLIVVGIGSSAGGLEALQKLLPNLPTESNLAYVIVQHLDPKSPSMLTSLLTRYTSMKLVAIKHKEKIKPNMAYVTPPGKNLIIAKRTLLLTNPSAAITPKPSVDSFFISLSKEMSDQAVGIILSGTGSDGAHGVRAIKAEGGITIAQEVSAAKYSGMPLSAIETGIIDLVLSPEEIGSKLLDLIKYPQNLPLKTSEDAVMDNLSIIFQILLEKTNCDFSNYKRNTIHRRIERRIVVNKLEKLEDYVHYLKNSANEVKLLYKDILISVTSFFRDPETFKELQRIITKIVETKEPGENIRIWVPGCATGEEAYSIAILLIEELGEKINSFNIQIFGTDIDTDAIEIARKGFYPVATVEDVPKPLLNRYFKREENLFQIKILVREIVVFSKQDMIRDPPFSRLDLVSCRNVLIYFNSTLQQQIIPLFHYVLRPRGYLFLGKSESVDSYDDLFKAVHRKWKIYQRKETSGPPAINFLRTRVPKVSFTQPQKQIEKKVISLRDIMNKSVADNYEHPGVLINERLEIVFSRGDISTYLTLSPGDTDLGILSMANPELRLELRGLIHKSTREGIPLQSKKLKLTSDQGFKTFSLHIRPIAMNNVESELTMVLFEEHPVVENDIPSMSTSSDIIDIRITELEHELTANKEHLQTTIEELETTNEELQSLNEELQATNEELQSSNEELETTNEELQCTNEEMTTVNEELHVRSAELALANSDLKNIMKRVGVAMVIVDQDLKVTRFTPPASNIFALSIESIGQVLTNIPCSINLPNIEQKLRDIIAKKKTIMKKIEAKDKIYQMQLTPYFSEFDTVVGVILIFQDQTDIRRAEEQLKKAHDELEIRVEKRTAELATANKQLRMEIRERKRVEQALKEEQHNLNTILTVLPDLITLKDQLFVYQTINPAFYQLLDIPKEEIVGKTDFDLFPRDEAEKFRQDERIVLTTGKPQVFDEEITGVNGKIWVETAKTPVRDEKGEIVGILSSIRDMSSRRQSEIYTRRINNVLKINIGFEKIIIQATNQLEFVRNICRSIVEEMGYHSAWIAIAKENSIIRPIAQWGYEDGFLNKISKIWEDSKKREVTGEVISKKSPIVIQNATKNNKYLLLREEAVKKGFGSCIALPLLHENICFGVLNICALESHAFETEEIYVLMELSDNLTIGIKRIDS